MIVGNEKLILYADSIIFPLLMTLIFYSKMCPLVDGSGNLHSPSISTVRSFMLFNPTPPLIKADWRSNPFPLSMMSIRLVLADVIECLQDA